MTRMPSGGFLKSKHSMTKKKKKKKKNQNNISYLFKELKFKVPFKVVLSL